jgi:CheY-like chemotaxis protein
MEALGTLASGIAHDFNNLLLAIMGNAELLEHSTGDAASVRKSVDGIRDAAIRARGIVQQILTFGRRSTVRQDPVQLSRILSEVKGVLEHLESDKHRITLDPVPTTLMVPGDASQLHQVFLNLVKNGLDALAESGGAVRIACDVVATPAVPSGSRPTVRITVSDTGSGIPPEVREHIFEPFFTTKGPGRGTGLGLSIVHGIVTSHGGEVGVASVVGAGTTVTVDLPLVRGVPGQAESEPVITSENRQLLLVDDDPSVLAVLVGLVESFGYSARAYDNVDDLLKELERASSDYFAVLTDLRIGARSGEEVVRAVRALSNPPRVFLLSGGLLSQEEFDVDGVPVAVIGKPFSRRELLEALNDPSYQLHTHRQTVQQSK